MPNIILGTGSHLPEKIVRNADFSGHIFYDKSGHLMKKSNEAIVEKMESISGIKERRYVQDDEDSIELAYKASVEAIRTSGISANDLDGIILAHNLGNLVNGSTQPQLVPNLAAHIKNRLKISNYNCVAYDILFGCPGWVEAMIQAHRILKLGEAKNILVIGVDVLSRCLDQHDMDVMLFGDGAGAAVLQASESTGDSGILFHKTYSHCEEELNYIFMDKAINEPEGDSCLKMTGRNVYKYAVGILPGLVADCLKAADVEYSDVSKFLFHQANEKMNVAIGTHLADLYQTPFEEHKFPMTIHCLGNTSVATVPTLLDLILKGKLDDHEIHSGDLVVFASVGAGMHANCIVYRF